MRTMPNVSPGQVMIVVMVGGALAVLTVMFAVVGAPTLADVGLVPLVAAGVALAALLLAVVVLVQRSRGTTDLERELRRLLEEEAGKPS